MPVCDNAFGDTDAALVVSAATPVSRIGTLYDQYLSLKAKNSDSVLIMRAGAFYNLFGRDAARASRIIGVPLAKTTKGVARRRIPRQIQLHKCVGRLICFGVSVAIAEEVEPRRHRSLARREVVRICRPGIGDGAGSTGLPASVDEPWHGATDPIRSLLAKYVALLAVYELTSEEEDIASDVAHGLRRPNEHDASTADCGGRDGPARTPASAAPAGTVADDLTRAMSELRAAEERTLKVMNRLDAIGDAIMAAPAGTLADLRVKAHIAGGGVSDEPRDEHVDALIRDVLSFRP